MTTRSLLADKLDAEFRETEARLEVLEAEANARQAKDDMAEISGLNARKERIQKKMTELKIGAAEKREEMQRETEKLLRDLRTDIDRAGVRYAAWDAARERRFEASLDKADAKVREWNAQEDQRKADRAMKRHDERAELQERIALGRARLADWQRARHERKAEEALEEASQQFNKAFDAAVTRYNG